MRFENLRKAVEVEFQIEKKRVINMINNTTAEDIENKSAHVLLNRITDRRYELYQEGKNTLDDLKKIAVKKTEKEAEKELQAQLEKIEMAENADDLEFFNISIDWIKSRIWGRNPQVTAIINGKRHNGHASGCGYDKESAAVAQALNESPCILKILYTMKEKGLQDGKTSNHEILGYGSGYGILPAFESGVGVNCFWRILEKKGYIIDKNHSKNSDFYSIGKK